MNTMRNQVNIRTILPEDIHARAKILAVKRKVDLHDLIPELIEVGLDHLETERPQEHDSGFSTAKSLKRFLGTWKGDDADEVLKQIVESRTGAEF
jgi:hypothetical protein